jgi:hypothetical protein
MARNGNSEVNGDMTGAGLEHLQEFAIFGKTEKIVLQQFGIQLGKF